MDTSAPKMLHFSTDDFPEHKRIEAYREIYGRTIVKHDIEPIGDQPFHFEATLCSVAGLGLASSVFSPCRRSLGRQHIDSDDLIFGMGRIGEGGGCVVQQRGREAVIGDGEAVLTSSADSATVIMQSTSRPLSLRIPNAVLKPVIADLDDRLVRRIRSDAAGLRLLANYVDAIHNTDALATASLCGVVVTHVYDLVSLVLGANGEARHLAEQRGVRAARRSAILRSIERESHDPGLTVGTVAALLGVTPRYVHLLLEETGRSFSHHLLERRLAKAAALLRDPAWQSRRIADIAGEAGFTDLSYFNRTFRRHFGATPTDVRNDPRWRE